jgi:hypothetical protein
MAQGFRGAALASANIALCNRREERKLYECWRI